MEPSAAGFTTIIVVQAATLGNTGRAASGPPAVNVQVIMKGYSEAANGGLRRSKPVQALGSATSSRRGRGLQATLQGVAAIQIKRIRPRG